jgi:hypothetical protein
MSKGGKMQRHFSNRGERLAEDVAAKMLVHHKPSAKSALINQARRLGASGNWFPQPVEVPRPPRKKQRKYTDEILISL